jgi:NADH:ubiquinone oxidoreductase subunit F (NADH-binding)
VSAAASRHEDPHAPRLLAGLRADRAIPLREHVARLGPLRRVDLIEELEQSGLRGRGGAGFPTAQKLRSVAGRRGRSIVVVNGTEAEPVSGKDKLLLRHAPHLVLDGAVAAATALGGREVIVAVGDRALPERAAVERAVAERDDGRITLRVAGVPPSFVAGEETALVSHLNGRSPKPTFKPPLPFERGVRGAPTLVQNAETLAHVGLIARFGAEWFRAVGTPDEPGTVLLTVSGAVRRPGVYEVELGVPLVDLVSEAGGVTEQPQAFLLGGYFGSWVVAGRAERLVLSAAGLKEVGASLGAGAIVVLPSSACGVAESARVARYLAGESAGQCGPCVHGLEAVAGALEQLAAGGRKQVRLQLVRFLEQVRGRGACRHPDGTARFVSSALTAFAGEAELHLRGRCSGHGPHVLPVPAR